MRARQHPVVVAVTTALLVLAAVAGPVQAGPATLTAIPTSSPISLTAGGPAAKVTVTNTDRRTSTSALTVSLAQSAASAPFAVVNDGCAGVILRPGESCSVGAEYKGSIPASDQRASLTVASSRPLKASVTRVFEVDVTFADVCIAHHGSVGYEGAILVVGALFDVKERCDWDSVLITSVYNATFEALSPECFDLGYGGMVGYPTGGETGTTAIGCVAN